MKWKLLFVVSGVLLTLGFLAPRIAGADATAANFNLQVSPSPLVTTVKPGTQTKLPLKIYGGGTEAENLKIVTRSFTFDSASGKVDLNDNSPATINSWITFSAPKFTVLPGRMFTQTVTINVPKDAGFSYSFALVISPQNVQHTSSGRAIKGSLAVFTLLNVDRPGATSNLRVVSFTSGRQLYEYLPATLSVRFRNAGNTISQPYGNIFVGRSPESRASLATLTINKNKSYILPGTERTFSAQWDDGFATYQPAQAPDGSIVQHFSVDWSKLSRFRIGRYTANLVAVYSDNGHDVPIAGTVSFWVVPWRAILVFILLVVGLWLLAHWRGKRRTEKAVLRALAQAEAKRKTEKAEP